VGLAVLPEGKGGVEMGYLYVTVHRTKLKRV
jgi:hypothetical protein